MPTRPISTPFISALLMFTLRPPTSQVPSQETPS